MYKTLFLLIPSFLFLVACGPNGKSDTSSGSADSAAQATDNMKADNAHNSQNALDWKGIYKGVLPCADCEGIETTLNLKPDGSFILQTRYLGKGDGKLLQQIGYVDWNEAENTVRLKGIENAPNMYFVGENYLDQLDLSGNKITGNLADKYRLTKQ